jgi:hypothetical protein
MSQKKWIKIIWLHKENYERDVQCKSSQIGDLLKTTVFESSEKQTFIPSTCHRYPCVLWTCQYPSKSENKIRL